MANEENLKKGEVFRFQSGEEAGKAGRLGGIASGEARRRKRDMRQAAKMLLEMPVSAKHQKMTALLKAFGVADEDMDYNMAILGAMLMKAGAGNVNAAKFLRDTAGENPFLALQERQFEYEVERKSGQGAEIEDISEPVSEIWGYEAWEALLNDGVPVQLMRSVEFQFGLKVQEYMRRSPECMYNIAEGAVRAGKTVGNILAFAMELCTSDDKFHLATGSTVANAKLNIGDSNGFGLEHIFRGQCRWGKYKDNDALIIRGPYTGFRERVVIFAGGGLSSSFQKIRGNSYGMWIATEINLHHDTFIKEAFSRTIAAKKRKFFWDMNPDHPKAAIYKQYIDKYMEQDKAGELLGGFNYVHLTLFDNVTITEERQKEIVSQYDPKSIWYIRDIEGKRSIAEGLIYPKFAAVTQSKTNTFKKSVEWAKGLAANNQLLGVTVGLDFGGTGSGHAFVCSAPTLGYQDLVALASKRYVDEIDPEQLAERFVEFVDKMVVTYGRVNHIYMDHEPVLIRGMQKALAKAGFGNIPVSYALKERINDRIFALTALQAQGRFYYTEDCENLEDALQTAVWDAKKIELTRLDDGTSDIDSLDAFEYSFEHDIRYYIDTARGR